MGFAVNPESHSGPGANRRQLRRAEDCDARQVGAAYGSDPDSDARRAERSVVSELRWCLPVDARGLNVGRAAELLQPRCDERLAFLPLRLGDRGQDVVPHREERAAQLNLPPRPSHEPEVEMRGTIPPTVHMNTSDAVEGPDGSFKPHGHHTQLGGKEIWEVSEIEV